ncbi:asmA protein [alpha proteobacterium U9-1i]|nr:asmA protein [alpha proteobacterium U9-1i]
MSGWLRWTFLILGGLVAAALIGAGALFYLVSRLDVRAEVERAVESATGRDLTIAGDVGVSFWPVLGLRAEDATLANVEGGRAPAFIAMDEIDVGVELRPLLDQDVRVRRLVLQRPRIALEVDAEGRPNWIMRPTTQSPPSRPVDPDAPPARQRAVSLREVRISDGEVSFFDARRGAGWVVGDADLSTAITSLSEPVRLEGSVRYNDKPVELEVELADPSAVGAGRNSAIEVEIESELLNASFDGQTTALSGEVAGAIQASGPSLLQLASWSGSPIVGGVGLGAFSVTGRIAIGGGRYDFSNAGFALDRIQGRGDFVLSQLRGKPYLSGRLELFDFDLNPYIGGEAPPAPTTPVEAPTSAQTASAPTAEIAAVAAPPRTVDIAAAPSERPIDFAGLRAINADLELTTHAVLVQHMRIDRGQLSLVLNDGFMAATLHNLTLYGGSGRGRFELDAREAGVRTMQDLVFDGVDTQRFLSDAVNFGNIEGRGELALNLRTNGTTQAQLINNARGRVHLEVVSGALRGVDLGGVSRTIRNAMRGELIAPEARTPFHGFSATFAVANGALASSDLSFNTPDLAIPGIGVIDLAAKRLDMRMAPRSARGGGIVVPFSARGPFTALAYDSDIRGRARTEIEPRIREIDAAARVQ